MVSLPLASHSWDENEIKAIHQVIKSQKFTMGAKVAEYEKKFANFFGSRYSIMTSSGSAANLLMVASLFFRKTNQLKRGDEVIVPTVSWSTTYFPFQQYGLKLVFVDIDQHTLNFDLKKLKAAISNKTRAICAVNLLGNPNDFKTIKNLIKNKNIILLEDNCESMGAKYENKYAGTFGLVGTFSTFYSHHISTMEGGCVVTDDEEIYHLLLTLRAHGWTRDLPKKNYVTGIKSEDQMQESFKFVLPGYNVRPLEMIGAIGVEQLKKLPQFISTRRKNGVFFQELFSNHPFLHIQQEVGLSSWYGFAFIIKNKSKINRQEIFSRLSKNGVEVRPIVTGNFLRQDVMKYLDYKVSGKIEVADYIDKNGFYIGNHHYKIQKQLKLIANILK